MKFVCPYPQAWSNIYVKLSKASKDKGTLSRPPIPLVLNGWAFSSDYEKLRRWNETISWAEKEGISHLIPELTSDQKYMVYEYSTYDGSYSLTYTNHEPKYKPKKEEVKEAFTKLKESWSKIAGLELAEITHPKCFTGKKKRRLVLIANYSCKPPWGSWNYISTNKESFTNFRRSINSEISPLFVDHIDFIFRES